MGDVKVTSEQDMHVHPGIDQPHRHVLETCLCLVYMGVWGDGGGVEDIVRVAVLVTYMNMYL